MKLSHLLSITLTVATSTLTGCAASDGAESVDDSNEVTESDLASINLSELNRDIREGRVVKIDQASNGKTVQIEKGQGVLLVLKSEPQNGWTPAVNPLGKGLAWQTGTPLDGTVSFLFREPRIAVSETATQKMVLVGKYGQEGSFSVNIHVNPASAKEGERCGGSVRCGKNLHCFAQRNLPADQGVCGYWGIPDFTPPNF